MKYELYGLTPEARELAETLVRSEVPYVTWYFQDLEIPLHMYSKDGITYYEHIEGFILNGDTTEIFLCLITNINVEIKGNLHHTWNIDLLNDINLNLS